MNESPNESKRVSVNSLCPELSFNDQEIERMFAVLDEFGGFTPPTGELSIAFVSKSEISRIHEAFMQDDSPTDVITFSGDPDDGTAGEICVCPEAAQSYAKENGKEFAAELTLYLAHGYLHLCGFDDIEDDDKIEMRAAEQVALKTLVEQRAMPNFSLKT
jgi:probable rRNA maturation factor